MFGNLLDFGHDLLKVLFLVLCAAVSSVYMYGYSSKKTANAFIFLLCFLICSTQLFFLIMAATTVPGAYSRFLYFSSRFYMRTWIS